MQSAMFKGETSQARVSSPCETDSPPESRLLISRQNPSTVAVSYHDGAVLTFLFDRSTTIVDLVAMIGRAGMVRKVVL
ncbi:hypothetical protein [Acidithiobacillus sp.]|uniref:hypothetical protein n=1 Tax=Acidithiobacillus sp. TaxID=1872118 RepID=UPI003CFBCAE2